MTSLVDLHTTVTRLLARVSCEVWMTASSLVLALVDLVPDYSSSPAWAWPAGFGVTAKSTSDCRKMEPSGVVVFHQSDVGEYLRSEDDL